MILTWSLQSLCFLEVAFSQNFNLISQPRKYSPKSLEKRRGGGGREGGRERGEEEEEEEKKKAARTTLF